MTNQDLANLLDQEGPGYLLTQHVHANADDMETQHALREAAEWWEVFRKRLPEPRDEDSFDDAMD